MTTVLITGASSGFGTHLAKAFAAAKYDVVATGRDKTKLLALQKSIGKNCTVLVADIQTEKGLTAVAEAISERAVSTLVNNAGTISFLGQKPLSEYIADINSTLMTNTAAPIALCLAAHKHFVAHGGGRIVNINSAAGRMGNFSEAIYCASKWGLRGFSESVKDTWLKEGVYVTDVFPGKMAAGMAAHVKGVPLIDPDELAELIVKTCASESFYVRDMGIQRRVKLQRDQ